MHWCAAIYDVYNQFMKWKCLKWDFSNEKQEKAGERERDGKNDELKASS